MGQLDLLVLIVQVPGTMLKLQPLWNLKVSYLPTTLWIAADIAFPGSDCMKRYLTQSEVNVVDSPIQIAWTLNTILSKIRIAVEWGIGGVKKCFHWLNTLLFSDNPPFNSVSMEIILRLWNVRTRTEKIN